MVTVLFFNFKTIYAEGLISDPDNYNYLKDGEVLTVRFDNSIMMKNYDQIATTNTRYTTLGYTVKSADKSKSVVVPLSRVEVRRHADDPKVEEGFMLSVDKIDSGILYAQIKKADSTWFKEIVKGQTVYLDGVMTIIQNEKVRGKLQYNGNKYVASGEVYTTASGIKGARGWKNPSSLDTHFNKEVYLPPPTTDIGFIDAELKAEAIPGKIQRGTSGSVQVILDSSGSTASLMKVGSDLEELKIKSRRYWVSIGGAIGEGYAQEGENFTINLENVTSETVITCRVRVYSQELADLNNVNISPVDEAVVNIYLGQQGIASAECNLGADLRGNEKFNVLQGIPTTESLYANIRTEKYIVDFQSELVEGVKTYDVVVSRDYIINSGEGPPVTRNVSETYKINREYSYNIIKSMAVYGIDRAVIRNACLPSGSVDISPIGYTSPNVKFWHSDKLEEHIIEPKVNNVKLPSRTVSSEADVPTNVDWKEEAEKEVGSIRVKNDKFIIDDYTILSSEEYSTDALDPQPIPDVESVGNNVLYKNNILIDAKTLNGEYPSTGTVYYELLHSINGGENERAASVEVNPVIVHTPVVCDPTITSDTTHNQEIKPDNTRVAMILGRTTQLNFPTIGKYINKKGYTGADLKKYTQDRIVKFPFDVYINKEFYKSGKEYHMPVGVDTIDVTVPTWVDENNYEVECRAIAINSPGNANLKQDLANISYANYIAEKKIPVRVIGRIYGFKLTDINDYPDWAGVFRTDTKSSKHSDNYYWVGGIDQDGQVRGNKEQFTLPVLNGSHTTKTNLGVIKKGYKIKYDLTTIGNYFNDKDCVRIKPTFYYVKKDGTGKQEVDLWYTEKINGINKVIKVGSNTDISTIRNIVLGEPYRNVPDEELKDTSRILGITKNEFTNQKAKMGSFGDIILTKPLRTFIGNTSNIPAGVDADRVKKSVQKWYGEYWIPDNTFACPKGYNVGNALGTSVPNGKEAFWLKDGYITVNFEIETLKNADIANPQLSYWNNPNANMWKMEGFNYTKSDSSGKQFSLKDGDVIFYYTDKKSLDDYSSGGTN